MRAALVLFGSIIAIGIAFGVVFALWHQQDEARAVALGVPYTDFNWHTAHGQDRGCAACHGANLAADVSRLVVARPKPVLHGVFTTTTDIPMRVEDCLLCHGATSTLPFAESVHSLHLQSASFVNMGGNCESCHATQNGKFALYDDETRYQVLNGIQKSPTPAFSQLSAAELTRLVGRLAAAR
jgi:mono/diheme cytochrome c family protein